MSDDQQPVQPPPPAYTPPPPAYSPPPQPEYQAPPAPAAPENAQPPAYSPGTPSPMPPVGSAPKKKKTWVIALVVVGVLLCCCMGGGVAALFMYAPEESVTTTGLTDSGDGVVEDVEADETDPRLQEWLDWNPAAPELMATAPSDKESLIAEGLAVVAPEFEFEEAVWYAGEYDAAEDWYYADGFFVRAKHPSSDDISAAVEMWIQSDEMVSAAVEFDLEEDDILDSAGGRQLVYNPQWGYGFVLAGEEDLDLWQLLGEQWPGGVVTRMEGDLTSGYEVAISKWDQYAIEGDYAAVWATYYYEDGEWTLDSWDYSEAVDSEDSST